jgi:hypothetical protein
LRTLAIAATALALALTAACDRPAPAPPVSSRTAGFPLLISRIDGLYYPPFLRDETTGPEANAYAVRLRVLLDDQPPQLSVAGQEAGSLRSEAIAASPLWGRTWLAALAGAGVQVLDAADLTALRRMRSAEGFYAEPGSGAGGDAYRAAATAAALEVLSSRSAITDDDRTVTGAWLTGAAGRRPDLRTAADLAEGLRFLGLPVPPGLLPGTAAAAPAFAGLSENARYSALLDAYSRAVLARDTGRPAQLEAGVWGNVLRQNATKLGFTDLYLLTVVALAAKAPAADFQPLRDRLAAERLPDGSIRESDAFVGSPEASLFALRLRRMAGESSADPGQVRALRAAAAEHPHLTPAEQLSLDAALRLAGDDTVTGKLAELCKSPAAVPATVTVANAEWWSRAALACAEAGDAVPVPAVAAWTLSEPPDVVAAATVVTGLADAGLHGVELPPISAADLHDWAAHPQRLPTTSGYAAVVRAYQQLGGTDPQVTATAGETFNERRGCADLPELYKADGSGSGCDFKATWAVWQLTSTKRGS